MAITTRDGLIAAMAAGRTVQFFKSSISTTSGNISTLWRASGQPSPNATLPTTTGTALTRTSVGAMPIPAPSATSYISSYEATASVIQSLILADRLVEFGGLSGTVTTAQSVSALALPSRATGALDVELWLEVYVSLGATAATTVTASYTNQSGTPGRTATLAGGIPANMIAGRTSQFTLAAGDTGVQSVQSLSLTPSTGTAGNVGLVLRRSLLTGPIPQSTIGFFQGYAETDLQQVGDDAALELLTLTSGNSSGSVMGNFGLAQG